MFTGVMTQDPLVRTKGNRPRSRMDDHLSSLSNRHSGDGHLPHAYDGHEPGWPQHRSHRSSRTRPANDRETSISDANGWSIESAGQAPDSAIAAGSEIGLGNPLKVETRVRIPLGLPAETAFTEPTSASFQDAAEWIYVADVRSCVIAPTGEAALTSATRLERNRCARNGTTRERPLGAVAHKERCPPPLDRRIPSVLEAVTSLLNSRSTCRAAVGASLDKT